MYAAILTKLLKLYVKVFSCNLLFPFKIVLIICYFFLIFSNTLVQLIMSFLSPIGVTHSCPWWPPWCYKKVQNFPCFSQESKL